MTKQKKIKMAGFKYKYGKTPKGYQCGCGATGIKLWREWNTFMDYQVFYCLACINKKAANGKVYTPTEDGKSLYDGVVRHWYQHDETEWSANGAFQWWVGWSGVPGEEPTGPNIRFKSDQQTCDQATIKDSGSICPAVPTEDGGSCWGYSSVPDEGCKWWYQLPYA